MYRHTTVMKYYMLVWHLRFLAGIMRSSRAVDGRLVCTGTDQSSML